MNRQRQNIRTIRRNARVIINMADNIETNNEAAVRLNRILRRTVRELNTMNENLSRRNSILQIKLTNQHKTNRDNRKNKRDIEKLKSENAELRTSVVTLTNQVDQLRERLNNIQEPQGQEQLRLGIADLQGELEGIQQEREREREEREREREREREEWNERFNGIQQEREREREEREREREREREEREREREEWNERFHRIQQQLQAQIPAFIIPVPPQQPPDMPINVQIENPDELEHVDYTPPNSPQQCAVHENADTVCKACYDEKYKLPMKKIFELIPVPISP